MDIEVDRLLIAPELDGGSYRTLVSIRTRRIGDEIDSIRVGKHYRILGRV